MNKSAIDEQNVDPCSPKPKKKQAVVVIHGMGEQRPMESIREFVNHVWKQDTKLNDPHFWNKPSSVCESFEQRRLTTDSPKINGSDKRVCRTDFYEYYWAHHTVGTKWEHFVGWFLTLLMCWPNKYKDHPSTLQPLWYILWAIILFLLILFAIWYCAKTSDNKYILVAAASLSVVWGFVAVKARKFFTQYFGDVARYVRAEPANIAVRQTIRKGGIELLERIHQTGEYDKIVLVGHSLGSIVAYDMLNHLWARHNKFKSLDKPKHLPTPLSSRAQTLADQLQTLSTLNGESEFEQEKYWQLQRELFNELSHADSANNWLISDFVTLGSPLTYADILLFENKLQFTKRKLDREYPTSPPVTENGNWYYGADSNYFLHHGAMFAAVKWTNIYMPHKCIIKGDLISGPVSHNFSYCNFNNATGYMSPPKDISHSVIQEIPLDFSLIKNGFTHTEYWKSSPISHIHIEKLRCAVGLYSTNKQHHEEKANA